MSARPPRSAAEWTTFAVSSVILLLVVAAIVVRAFEAEAPAAPVAEVTQVRQQDDRFFVTVAVGNDGDRTAEAVQVVAELEVEGETTEADEVVDFLAGGDEAELVFVFDDDPEDGELTVRIAGFVVP